MPLQMVHLGVAHFLAENLPINEKNYFYLGCISPDAVHMRSGFVASDKANSHLYNQDCSVWKSNAVDFMAKNRESAHGDFYSGYAAHILTDIIWAETVYSEFRKKYAGDASPVQDQKWAYYNDTDILDFLLYERLEFRSEMWLGLSDDMSIGAEGLVSSEEVKAWQERILHWYDSGESKHKNPVKYIGYSDLTDFIRNASTQIKKFMNTK